MAEQVARPAIARVAWTIGRGQGSRKPHVAAARAIARPTPRSDSAATTDTSHAISPSSCSQSCNIAHPLGNCHCRFNSRGTIGFSTDARHNDAGTRLAPVGELAQPPRPDATVETQLAGAHPESNLPRNRTCNEAGRARRKRRRSASTTTDHRQQHMSARSFDAMVTLCFRANGADPIRQGRYSTASARKPCARNRPSEGGAASPSPSTAGARH